MRGLVAQAGLAERVMLDSAGTGAYHVGEQPDSRSCAAAKKRSFDLTTHRAWQFTVADFARFDLVVAMDGANLRNLRAMAARAKGTVPEIVLLRSFDAAADRDAEVPDPWYGGDDGFEEVLDQCERACAGLLAHVRAKL
jgi:protein-tyrosine phosphatase